MDDEAACCLLYLHRSVRGCETCYISAEVFYMICVVVLPAADQVLQTVHKLKTNVQSNALRRQALKTKGLDQASVFDSR